MPVVPRYGERRVGTAAIPGVRRIGAETPTSQGADLQRARQESSLAIASLGGDVARMGMELFAQAQAEERQRANEVAALKWTNQLGEWVHRRLYDPEQGALTLRGEAALGLPEQVRAEFDQFAGEIEARLGTDEQRQAFLRDRMQTELTLDSTLRRHVFQEMRAWEAEEHQKLLQNTASQAALAAMDPRRVAELLARGTAEIRRYGHRQHTGPEALQAQIEAWRSDVHSAVVRRLLNTEHDQAARAYYDTVQSELSGEAVEELERLLAQGELRGQAQRETDRILGEAGGDEAAALAAARQLEGRLRDEVVSRVRDRFAESRALETRTHQERLVRVGNLLDQTPSTDAIPIEDWDALTVQEKRAFAAYAKALREGEDIVTDWPTYYRLVDEAGTAPGAFRARSLWAHRHQLGTTEWKQLLDLQLRMRQGEETTRTLDGFRTKQQILDDTLLQYGIDPRSDDGAERRAIAQLRRMLDARLESFEALTGKAAAPTDIQQALDELLGQQVTVPGSFWSIWPGGRPFSEWWRGRQVPLINVTVDQIPAEERQAVEEALRLRGQPVTDATVLDLWLEHQARTQGR